MKASLQSYKYIFLEVVMLQSFTLIVKYPFNIETKQNLSLPGHSATGHVE